MSMDTIFQKSVSVVARFGSLHLNFISMHSILLTCTEECVCVCVDI